MKKSIYIIYKEINLNNLYYKALYWIENQSPIMLKNYTK